MNKVAFYINKLSDGGAERVICNLANQFANAGYSTVLISSFYTNNEYDASKNVKRLSLEHSEIKQSRLKRNISRIWKLRKICKAEKPDVLISFMQEPNFRAIIATRGLPIKTIVSVRNDPNQEYAGKIGKVVGKVLLPLADGCVFQTEEAKAWFPKKLQQKSVIIYNAVKEDFFHVEHTPIRGEIVTCGRLTEQKNQAMLISAFAEVNKSHPEATLKIYGEGKLYEKLQNQIDELGVSQSAKLMGNTNDVASALKTADIFVLPSDYEGMPNALMEAMAVGIPCISTDCPCGGPKMLLKDEINGFLIPVNDANGLTAAIKKILDEPMFAQKVGIEAQKSARNFRSDIVLRQWEKYIMDVIR